MPNEKTYTVTATIDGSRVYFRGKTKSEAEQKRAEALAKTAAGLKYKDDTTFRQLTDKWMSIYSKQGKHIRTIETKQGIFDRYILPVIGDKKIKDIDVDDIDMLVAMFSGFSLSTQKKIIQCTNEILDRAVAKGIIARSPAVGTSFKPTAKKPKEVVPLTDSQCETLLKATKGTRVHLFLMVLRFLGLRKGEALGLMWTDIDFDEATLHVQRSIVYPLENKRGVINPDMKTENADRVLPICDSLLEELKEEKQKSKSQWVFSMQNGEYLSESSFRKMWALIDYRSKDTKSDKTLIDRTIDFEVHPHLLRHTCVTAWLEAGLDITEVQYLAGHASPDITTRIYTHFRKEQRLRATSEKVRSLNTSFAIS